MSKVSLPTVTIETIQQIGEQALKDNASLFRQMTTSNPDLYRFAYEMHERPETTKTTMLGVLVAVYAALELEVKKGKKDRRRLKHAKGESVR